MIKSGLQIAPAVVSAIAILTGALNLIGGSDSLRILDESLPAPFAAVDSQIRFFGAIWLGFGVTLFWIISTIEKHTTLFRLLMAAIFLGGVGRLLSAITIETPPLLFVVLMVFELLGTPALIFWQSRLNEYVYGQL